ncbi:hypothetical protein FPV67DRAFT_1650749 [Lyophyllum atratum]|nr:hypothetical protein FPV67DRAFT_1650749 [Lyophyllum atratum]
MGPNGVRSLLLEMHTLRFSVLQAQYLEAVFELVRGRQDHSDQIQSTLHSYMSEQFLSFGNFGDPQGYAGLVPSEFYLAQMMNKAIEGDEHDANQHTACLAPDQLAIDDSHKINKHIAKADGIPVFGALWTCMSSRYIRAQALTLTKAHEERAGPLSGIANSIQRYGFCDPPIVFSDDPVKDKQMIHDAFPSLLKGLTPMAAAYGLKPITIPDTFSVTVLDTAELTETTFASIMAPLDINPDAHISQLHKFSRLPTSLLRLLISSQVFKIGSSIKGDLTRVKKEFSELADQTSFNLIDLKEYCIQHGVIARGTSGTLDSLVEKALGMYLPKDSALRKSEDWELKNLHPDHVRYAALDVYASRMVFAHATKLTPLESVKYDSSPGTRIALVMQEGGDIVAYGAISAVQPTSIGSVRVKTPTKSRLLVDIDDLINPSVAAILHLLPRSTSTKPGCLTLGQLQAASSSTTFQVVAPLSLLLFDRRDHDAQRQGTTTSASTNCVPLADPSNMPVIDPILLQEAALDSPSPEGDAGEGSFFLSDDTDTVDFDMLEAHSQVSEKGQGKKRQHDSTTEPSALDPVSILKNIVNSPPITDEFTRLKKDLFHTFQMIPTPVNHGTRPEFLRTLRNHIMRWDPGSRKIVDITCRRIYNLSFDEVLRWKPRWIAERTPRHVPSPSILVPALEHVFNVFGNSIDVSSKQPLFSKLAWKKAKAVIELARQGYLSDIEGIPMYERAGIDKHGLQKWKCLRGTNNVEGGPHGDIYHHRTWYNLQAFAKHLYGVDWDYHHCLSLINRTSFLLNYLSDVVGGADMYAEWINGDLYEKTTEQFGICHVPESLRIRLSMDCYNEQAASSFKLNASDDWLRRRQGLALPALPPTTPEARQYFFTKVRHFAALASASGKGRIDYEAFAQEWNRTADGKYRFYVTTDVLVAYAKTWEKASNIRASKELISDQLDVMRKTADVFAARDLPFPSFITATPTSIQPCQGVIDVDPGLDGDEPIPASLTIDLARSHPVIQITPTSRPIPSPRLDTPSTESSRTSTPLPQSVTTPNGIQTQIVPEQARPAKRRRIVSASSRKRKVRRCRRCSDEECRGNSDILNCPQVCMVPCKQCMRFSWSLNSRLASVEGSVTGLPLLLQKAIASFTFPHSSHLDPPFGRFTPSGDSIFLVDGIKSWIVEELVSPLLFLYTFPNSPLSPSSEPPSLTSPQSLLSALYLVHYANRAILSPVRTPSLSKSHLIVPLVAVAFNTINGAPMGAGICAPTAHSVSRVTPTTTTRHLTQGPIQERAEESQSRGARPPKLAVQRRLIDWFALPAAPVPFSPAALPSLDTPSSLLAALSPSTWASLATTLYWHATAPAQAFAPALKLPHILVIAEVLLMLPEAVRGHRWYHRRFGAAYPSERKAVIGFWIGWTMEWEHGACFIDHFRRSAYLATILQPLLPQSQRTESHQRTRQSDFEPTNLQDASRGTMLTRPLGKD